MRKFGGRRSAKGPTKIDEVLRTKIQEQRFSELLEAGFDRRALEVLLLAFASASDQRKPPLAGMKTRDLERMALHVAHVAQGIRTLNETVLEDSGLALMSGASGQDLSFELALYATRLLHLPKMSMRNSDRQLIKLLLVAGAWKLTGEPRYTALSELLTAALHSATAEAGADTDESNEVVTPEALLQLAKDHESLVKEFEGQFDSLLPHLQLIAN